MLYVHSNWYWQRSFSQLCKHSDTVLRCSSNRNLCGLFLYHLINNMNLTSIGKKSLTIGFIILELIVCNLKFPLLNGSEMYLGPLFFLYFFAASLRAEYKATSNFLFMAAVSFSLSIFFRIIDMTVCEFLPVGTHFLWHSFNSLTLLFAYCSLEQLYKQKSQS